MSADIRFDDQVVIITGAGRGLGRAHARYLAARGAAIVVNDLGTDLAGGGTDAVLARAVVEEIEAQGGQAVASGANVETTAGAEAIVAAAIERFGRVDAVINNAGILAYKLFPEVELDSLMRHLAVHVAGTFNVTRAAWPHMVGRGYGRVVNTSSSGLFGSAGMLPYSTCKGALVSMTGALAEAGAAHGIKVNAIAPAAETRMVTDTSLRAGVGLPPVEDDRPQDPTRAPEAVSPMIAVLAHQSCPVTGQILSSGLGRLARIFVGETEGFVEPGLGPEEILMRWERIVQPGRYTTPASTAEYVTHREAQIAAAAGSTAPHDS